MGAGPAGGRGGSRTKLLLPLSPFCRGELVALVAHVALRLGTHAPSVLCPLDRHGLYFANTTLTRRQLHHFLQILYNTFITCRAAYLSPQSPQVFGVQLIAPVQILDLFFLDGDAGRLNAVNELTAVS